MASRKPTRKTADRSGREWMTIDFYLLRTFLYWDQWCIAGVASSLSSVYRNLPYLVATKHSGDKRCIDDGDR